MSFIVVMAELFPKEGAENQLVPLAEALVEETLKELSKKYDLLVLSNCQKGYIEAFLAGSKLGHLFKDHICWGDNFLSKSENLRLLVQRGGYGNAMYVGDTLYDEEVATFDEDNVYNQADSAGFINLFGLPIKVKAKLDQKRGK